MDYCTISYHRPEPLVCQGEGRARLDAWDGRRRLLGELVFQAPVTLHFVEVEAVRRSWLGQDRWPEAGRPCRAPCGSTASPSRRPTPPWGWRSPAWMPGRRR